MTISIYIHWPFCLKKCPYCDFNSHVPNTDDDMDYDKWLGAYLTELQHFAALLKDKTVTSIFFGGGTPSLMAPKIVEKVINKISSLAYLAPNSEITLEANPTSVEQQKFIDFRSAGINRISVGVQSFFEQDLKFLGRQHSAGDGIAAVRLAQKYFSNYSFDLIYARPEQSLESWKTELDIAMDLAGPHLSLYQLTIEKGTKFFSLFKNGDFTLPNEDISCAMYNHTFDKLQAHGLEQYEVSNYAKPSFESQHNLRYWDYGEYLGIGPGSHSRIRSTGGVNAMSMIYSPTKWLDNVAQNGHGIDINTPLTTKEIVDEIVMMGLRSRTGISSDTLKTCTGRQLEHWIDMNYAQLLEHEEFIIRKHGNITLTRKGMLMHSYITSRLLSKSAY